MSQEPTTLATSARCPAPRRHRRLLERLFTHGLDGPTQATLMSSVRGCDTCRRLYLRYLAAERAAVHNDPEAAHRPTHFENERLLEQILARATASPGARRGRLTIRPVAWVLVTMVSLVIISGALWQFLRPQSELTPRGGTTADVVSVRALRLFHHEDQPTIEGPLPAADGGGVGDLPRLRINDTMLLLYTNRGSAAYTFVVGVDNAWSPLWYFPAPPDSRSVRIEGGVADRPLGDPIQLSVNHRMGPLTLFTLTSPRPLSIARVQQALDQARLRREVPSSTVKLPLPADVHQAVQRYLIVR